MSDIRPFTKRAVITAFVLATMTIVVAAQQYDPRLYSGLRWRSIGPFRAGRVNAVSGVVGQPETFYFGSVGGGVWKRRTQVAPGPQSLTRHLRRRLARLAWRRRIRM